MEDLATGTETAEQLDFSFYTEQLQEWLKSPLDLNSASRYELRQLPGMDDMLVSRLMNHIKEFGPLISIYELQAVAGFPLEVCHLVQPFVKVNSKAKDLDPGNKHPLGPGLDEITQGLQFSLIQRLSWIVEEQKGYSAPDTSYQPVFDEDGLRLGTDTVLSSRYQGNPLRLYTRLSATYSSNVSFSLVGEKDPGELFTWNPLSKQYGYDFLSANIHLKDFGRLKRLVMGDYSMQTGQGLALSRGLGFGKGAQVISSIKSGNRGLLPYQSVNENQFQRGIAATFALGDIYLTGLFSRLHLDANLEEADTLSNEIYASSIRLGGLHRTKSESSGRKTSLENLWGGRVEYRSPTLTLGGTHYFQHWEAPIQPALNDYNIFSFRGRQNYVSAVDFDWVRKNVNIFGEFARSRSGGMATILGLMSSLAYTVDFSLLIRRFDKDFHSNKAYVFAERPTTAQNETGIYMGLRITPNTKWTMSTYFDQYYFSWNKFRTAYPTHGWEFMSQLQYKPRRTLLIYLRFRSDNQQRNAELYPPRKQVKFLVPIQKKQLRLHFQYQIHRNIQAKIRAEYSWFRLGAQQRETGFLLYQDLVYRWGYKWRISGRYAIFDISDFDARIYAYENDIPGQFSILAYQGIGSRYYIILNYKLTGKLEIWGRVSQTRLQDSRHIGTGLERIRGGKRSEIKLQLKWAF